MDGTLIDSIDFYHGVLRDVTACLGVEKPPSREALLEALSHGKKLSDVIFPADMEDRATLVERFRSLSVRAFEDAFSRGKIELIDGVEHLFERLKGDGFSLAIVTSSVREMIVPFLRQKRLYSYLDCVLGRAEARRLKPSPDPLLKCLETLQVDPSDSVYIGDSIIDIRAGKGAGTGTIGVLTGASDLKRLQEEAPDAILESVTDLPTIL